MRNTTMRKRACASARFATAAAFACMMCVGPVVVAQPLDGARVAPDAQIQKPVERPIAELLYNASSMTPTELKSTARFLGAESYNVSLGNTFAVVEAPDGALMFVGSEFGARTTHGEVIHHGLLWNVTNEPVRVRIGEKGSVVTVQPRALFGIGWLVDAQGNALTGGGCSVSCADGKFACCNPGSNTDVPTCKCVTNGTKAPCQSGGPGATACGIDQLTIIE